jgi:hypothetical protein
VVIVESRLNPVRFDGGDIPRDWLGADHGSDRRRGLLIAPTTSSPPCN